MRSSAAVIAAACLLAGCGTADDREQARGVVERFYAAVEAGRGEEACALLSPAAADQLESQTGQSCDGVITRLELAGGGVADVHVYAVGAKVDVRGGESAFLSRAPGRWQLTAIGCRPAAGPPTETPMDCEVEA